MSPVFDLFRFQRIAVAGCAALLALCLAGCGSSDSVEVKLQARPVPQTPVIFQQIEAEVAGPADGLHYKWFAVAGDCEPQQSDEPRTIFKFPEGVRQDRVTVEVWRKGQRIAQNEIKVKFDEEAARREQVSPPGPQIEISRIPPAELGGPSTHAEIAGKVSGQVLPGELVAIYCRAYGEWYIQPEAGHLIEIGTDKHWGSWTHTGSRYAALLVRPDFEPLTKLDMLPQTNSEILAVAIVDGVQKDESTNASQNASPTSQ